ncbi:MAG TPA: hypothetical protein VFN87_21135 [Solirubrobacteraceae bacterium]|nr:hypothetical protein [Solirubrobacteraceae bacterium]
MKRYLPIVLSLFALAVPATAGATTFGAEVNSDFTSQVRGQWSQAQVLSNLSALYKAGGRVGRADSNWPATEPKAPIHGRHRYNWSYDDLIVSEMASARLRWEPTLAFAPRWAEVHRPRVLHLKGRGRVIAFLPPKSNATFAAYATAFMKRYGPHGAFWKHNRTLPYVPVTTVEVWNEPDNLYDWGQHINLSDYARMYEAVRTAVHRVDRHARVMTGGLAWTQSSLPRLLKAFRGKPMDALAVHPYGANPRQTIALARVALADMRRAGRGRTPISANEFGWTSIRNTWGSTNPRHVKGFVYQALIGLAKLRLAEIEPFSWSDPSWGLSTGSFARAVAKIHHPRSRARHSRSKAHHRR